MARVETSTLWGCAVYSYGVAVCDFIVATRLRCIDLTHETALFGAKRALQVTRIGTTLARN